MFNLCRCRPGRAGGALVLSAALAGPTLARPAAALAAGQQGETTSGIERLVERVQERYRQSSHLEARFVQRSMSRFGAVAKEASGRMWVRLPGRMRWEYDDEQLFVADGTQMFLYQPADKMVQVFITQTAEASRTPVLYLAGQGDLLRDFDVEETEWGPPLAAGNVQLRLMPRRQDATFLSLVLEVEPMRATIVRLVQVDSLELVTDYQFHEVRFDVDPPPGAFEFAIPPGVEVVYIGG